jgi:hypothetical protein
MFCCLPAFFNDSFCLQGMNDSILSIVHTYSTTVITVYHPGGLQKNLRISMFRERILVQLGQGNFLRTCVGL